MGVEAKEGGFKVGSGCDASRGELSGAAGREEPGVTKRFRSEAFVWTGRNTDGEARGPFGRVPSETKWKCPTSMHPANHNKGQL